MDQTQFAQKIREKYPGAYDHVDDATLVNKIIEKYPVYKDKVKLDTPMDQGSSDSEGQLDSQDTSPEEGSENKNPTPWASRAVGWTKGLAQGPIETAHLLQKLGQVSIAALDPHKTYEQVKQETGIESLDGPKFEEIRKMMESSNKEETQGKAMEFIAELLWPTSKATEIEKGLNKGKDLINKGVQKGENMLDGAAVKVVDKTKEVASKLLTESPQPQYETMLKRIKPEQFDEYANVAKKASTDFKNATPLEVVGKKAQGALETIQSKVKAIGQKKSDLMGIGGVGTTPVNGKMVKEFNQGLQSYLNSKTITEGDTKLVRDVMSEMKKISDTPAANQVDKFIDFVQDKIYTSGRDLTVPVTDETSAMLRGLVGKLNNSLKSELPESYSKVNSEYSKLLNVRNELNSKLGKEGEKGGSLMKRVFSPSDANTKQLFDQVKELTGVDLVDEATLARMMMEITGDTRQASLLQQLDLPKMTKSGVLDRIWSEITKRANTPEAKLKKAKELLLQGASKEAVKP